MKYIKIISLFFILLLTSTSSCSKVQKIIDGCRKLTNDENIKVCNLIKDFYNLRVSDSQNDLQKFFDELNVKINISYNDLNKIIPNDFELFDFNKLSGKIISYEIKETEFSKGYYDYPIGNLFYAKVKVKYDSIITNEEFFIISKENKIYEYRISIMN